MKKKKRKTENEKQDKTQKNKKINNRGVKTKKKKQIPLHYRQKKGRNLSLDTPPIAKLTKSIVNMVLS